MYNLIQPEDLVRASTVRRVTSESSTGSFHTLDIGIQRKLTITKEHWDQHHLEVLEESGEAGNTAEVGAVVLGEGKAIVCLMTNNMTLVQQRIQVSMPRKRAGAGYGAAASGAAKTSERFNDQVYKSPEVMAQLQDTKFTRENQVLDKFLRTLSSDDLRAWYGERAIVLAASRGAIGTLLPSDAMLRSTHPMRRKQWVDLCDQVKSFGGSVVIFSSLHESGRQLNGLGGVAALLTYPLDLDLVEEEEAEMAQDSAAQS